MPQKKKVKVVQVAISGERMTVLDGSNRVWERLGDMKIGKWGEVDLPDEPAAESKRRARKR